MFPRGRGRQRGRTYGAGVFTGTVNMLSFGDSLTAFNGSYSPATNGFMIDSTKSWTVSKSNPCVVTIPSGHTYTTGQKVYFFGFIGQPEINEIETTITVISGTQFSLDGVNSTGWTGTYDSYGRTMNTDSGQRSLSTRGFLTNMDMLTGGRINIPLKYVRGVSGDNASNFVNRLQYEFPASFSDVNAVHILGGRNDLNSAATAATVYDSLMDACDWIWTNRGSNIKIFLGTVCPNDSATAPIIAQMNALNALIRATNLPNLYIVDYNNAVDNGSGLWISGYGAVEATVQHPSALGAWSMGRVLRDKVKALFGQGVGFVLNAGNKLPNPELAGTGGSASGVTNNGCATSAIVSATGTGGVSTDRTIFKDGNGRQGLQINCPSGKSNQTLSLRIDPSGLVVGDEYVAEAEVEVVSWSGTGTLLEMSLRLQAIGSVNPTNPSTITNGQVSGAPNEPFNTTQMVTEGATKYFLLRTPKLRYITGESSMRTTFLLRYDTTAGSIDAVFKLRRMQTYKV